MTVEQVKELIQIQFLINEEGCVLHPYLDSIGVPTIGMGCTFYEDGRKVTMADPPITKERAIELAYNLLAKNFMPDIFSALKVPQNSNQLTADTSIAWNIGNVEFKKSTLCQRINNRASKDQITAAFEMWKLAGGKPILLARRKREAKLYFTPMESKTKEIAQAEALYDEHIRNIQKALSLPQTGIYDLKTIEAVKAFQSFHKLKADGIAGRMTMNVLNIIITGQWNPNTVDLR